MVRICFVCLGNICRSPTAQGVFTSLARKAGVEAHVESAGTGGWHVGESPDPRTIAAAKKRGVHLTSLAQQFNPTFFERFDYIIAMDAKNRADLLAQAPNDAARAKVSLMRDFDPSGPRGLDVPDPYYGAAAGFDDVFEICERACRGLLNQLVSQVSALHG